MKRLSDQPNDRGAAAIEFALVLPILLILVLGIMEFGRVYNAQISVSNAAREAARTMAIENDPAVARDAAIAAAPSLNPALSSGQISVTPDDCGSGGTATVSITYTVEMITGFFLPALDLTGTGVMRCGG